MLTLKSQLTCSYCSRIVKNPILLPCDDSICGEHLSETNVVKENKIRCKECNKEFEVTCDEFRTIKSLNKLIESQSYLSGEERSLKQELEDKIRKFFQFYDDFVQTREKIDSVVFEYFQEMRNQIDEHREKLKEKIDEIALAMIDRTKTCEEEQLNSIKEKLFENSSFDETKSLLTELNQIEETFRYPNLLIETIKEMQRKQDESLRDIQSKLNEINQVKDNLKASNEFQPNLSFFDQEDQTSLFGSIKLFENQSNVNSLKCEILNNQQQYFDLIKLCEFSPNDKWSILYRGTRDGFGSDVFHSKCDGLTNTLTLFKAKQSSYIFGGFCIGRLGQFNEMQI
jgi:hypothetical protein